MNEDSHVSRELYTEALFSDNFHYLGAERFGPRAVLNKSDFQTKVKNDIGVAGEYIADIIALKRNQPFGHKKRFHPNSTTDTFISQLEAWASEISPGIRINTEEFIGTDQIRLTYTNIIPSGQTKPFRATNVGFGVSYVLPVIVLLLAAQSGDLIIIDTPEAHLHPSAQLKIGELISLTATDGVQVIIETHSDHILNGIRLSIYNEKITNNEVIFRVVA